MSIPSWESKHITSTNMSALSPDEFCQLAYSFRQEKRFVFVTVIQSIMSFFSLIFIYLLFKSQEMRRIWKLITRDLKIIVFLGFCFFVTSSLNAFIMFSFKTIILLMDLPACDYVWQGWVCFYTQRFYSAAWIRAFGIIHFTLLFERLCSSLFPTKHQRYDGIIGTLMALIVIITTPLPHISFIDRTMYQSPRPYCGKATTVYDKNLIFTNYSVIVLDVFVTIGEFLLYIRNKREVKLHKRHHSNFALEYSFKLREIQLSISIIYPFSVVYSITYGIQMFGYYLYTTYSPFMGIVEETFSYECVNFLRCFSNFTLMGFLWMFSKGQKRSNVLWVRGTDFAEEHFKEFRRIIY